MNSKLSPEEVIQAAQDARREGKLLPIDLPGADLTGALLSGTDLVGANLEGADLTGVTLAGAFLKRANLKNAVLVGASLDGADLTEADLRGADLAGSRMDDAIFAGARLDGACLQLVLGDPLSMSGATMDQITIERSEFTMRDVAMMVVRGAWVAENEQAPISLTGPSSGDTDPPTLSQPPDPPAAPGPLAMRPLAMGGEPVLPPSDPQPDSGGLSLISLSSPPSERASDVHGAAMSDVLDFDRPLSSIPAIRMAIASLPPSSRHNVESPRSEPNFSPKSSGHSIVPSFRQAEIATRITHLEQDLEQMPVSQRMFHQLNALIEGARIEAAPVSLRPAMPVVREMVGEFVFPTPGDDYLGVTIEEEMPSGTTSRCFRGKTADGRKVVVRVFDPHCEGAALQLPAFQRGLRALNKLQGLGEDELTVAELIAVATDHTAYVAADYQGQTLAELVDVKMTLRAGLEAVCSLARTVAAVHRHGVMIRAWKPSNVLVEGLKLVLSEPDMVHLSTLAQYRGDAGGYRAYAAPEELLGRGTRSPTADVFSLGKMLEFLLTGQEPLVQLGSPPLISQRENVPEVLVQIVRRATAQEPAERYQKVDDLLSDLENFQNQGERTVLLAPIRPVAVSQLSVHPLSTSPVLPDVKVVLKERIESRKKPVDRPPPLGRARQIEVALALFGGVGGLAFVALLLAAPRSVETMSSLNLMIAGFIGLAALGLPVPKTRRVLYRLSTWFSLSCLIWLVDPLSLARITWDSRLSGGTTVDKQEALKNLSRLGERDAAGAVLSGGDFTGMDLSSMNFSGADLTNANLSNAFLVETRFDGARVSGARFHGANLFSSTLSRAVDFSEAQCNRYTKLPKELICDKGFISPAPEEEFEDEPADVGTEGEVPKSRRTSDRPVVLPPVPKP